MVSQTTVCLLFTHCTLYLTVTHEDTVRSYTYRFDLKMVGQSKLSRRTVENVLRDPSHTYNFVLLFTVTMKKYPGDPPDPAIKSLCAICFLNALAVLKDLHYEFGEQLGFRPELFRLSRAHNHPIYKLNNARLLAAKTCSL